MTTSRKLKPSFTVEHKKRCDSNKDPSMDEYVNHTSLNRHSLTLRDLKPIGHLIFFPPGRPATR